MSGLSVFLARTFGTMIFFFRSCCNLKPQLLICTCRRRRKEQQAKRQKQQTVFVCMCLCMPCHFLSRCLVSLVFFVLLLLVSLLLCLASVCGSFASRRAQLRASRSIVSVVSCMGITHRSHYSYTANCRHNVLVMCMYISVRAFWYVCDFFFRFFFFHFATQSH